ncbi:MAG: beta-glucosidase, partial [Gammaproteobacteria bacterium]|nr:beta-glucosidase [Gammaproteobacteria bacterium]
MRNRIGWSEKQPCTPESRSLRSAITAFIGLAAALTITALQCAELPVDESRGRVTGEARVNKLLAEMTLEEKIALIQGSEEDASTDQGQAGYLPGVKRLGVPGLRLADGPPGILTRLPSPAPTSTMGLAATFSTTDAEQNGRIIGLEAK